MLGFCCLNKIGLTVYAERAGPCAGTLGAEQEERFTNREVRQRVVVRSEPGVVGVVKLPVNIALVGRIPLEVTITRLAREAEGAGLTGLGHHVGAD